MKSEIKGKTETNKIAPDENLPCHLFAAFDFQLSSNHLSRLLDSLSRSGTPPPNYRLTCLRLLEASNLTSLTNAAICRLGFGALFGQRPR